MKRIFHILILVSTIWMCSCSNQMEFPRVIDFNLDSVLTSYTHAQKMVNNLYDRPVPMNFDTRGYGNGSIRFNGGSFASAITDEGQSYMAQSGYYVQKYYNDNVEASWSYNAEDSYDEKWAKIRRAYILINNIDKVPDATYEQKMRIKGESKLMVAIVYFEMFKRYGGVPIQDREYLPTDSSPIEYAKPRATLEQTYNFILGLIEEVIRDYKNYIPANYNSGGGNLTEFGRLPMAMAYALKARLMLYAASPLFNSDTPYTNSLGANSNLISFMGYKQSRWTDALNTANEAIDYCLANGYSLVDVPSQRNDGQNYSVANIKYPSEGNTEVIWGTIQKGSEQQDRWIQYTQIRGAGLGIAQRFGGYASNMSTVNQLERYELKAESGTYRDWDTKKEYSVSIPGNSNATVGGKLLAEVARKPFEGLDPRFHASISYNGVEDYCDNSVAPPDMANAYTDDQKLETSMSGICASSRAGSIIPLYVRKYTRGYEGREKQMFPICIYMRMAELYMIRAEALNELGRTPEAYADLELIRARSGMPPVKSGLSGPQMAEAIAHERNIELYYEDHRWFDLRRTLKAAEKIPTKIYTLEIRKWYHTKNDAWPYKITYEKALFGNRKWNNRWYLNYFPSNEVNKGYGLIQNPGW